MAQNKLKQQHRRLGPYEYRMYSRFKVVVTNLYCRLNDPYQYTLTTVQKIICFSSNPSYSDDLMKNISISQPNMIHTQVFAVRDSKLFTKI